MRVLFCIDRYQPARGGAERYLHDLVSSLIEQGHEPTVAALEFDDHGAGEKLQISCPTQPRLFREIAFALKTARLKKRAAFDRVVGFRHVLDVDRFQPHEGLFIDSLQGALRAAARSPAHRRLLFMKRLMSPKNLFFLAADRALFKHHPGLKVAALSGASARSIGRRCRVWNPEVTTIPNGVDTARFLPRQPRSGQGPFRTGAGLEKDTRLVLFVAHNFRLKGLSEALQGLATYARTSGNSFALFVAGAGRPRPYAAQIKQLGLDGRVFFLGPVDDMPALYSEADLLLHPTFYDPCSLVVLEALGCGVPVITTRFNGAAELMADHEAGNVLTDPRDPRAMAEALSALLDGNDQQRYRTQAAQVAARNSFQQHAKRMEEWIREQ